MGKFCDIQSRNELADYLKIPRKKLSYLLYILTPDKCYHSFEIPKRVVAHAKYVPQTMI